VIEVLASPYIGCLKNIPLDVMQFLDNRWTFFIKISGLIANGDSTVFANFTEIFYCFKNNFAVFSIFIPYFKNYAEEMDSCREIAFCPVVHFILSYPLYRGSSTMAPFYFYDNFGKAF